ncbi:MAG: response regulator transcription factor [Chloroflexi bacterium]|nr:response regulator transcription factor [Chloroflexota bacterium]
MPVSAHQVRVLIIAGDPLARAGLAALLATQPPLIVVGQVAPAADLTTQIAAYQPTVLLWDLGWNPTGALEALAELTDGGLPVLTLVQDETQTGAVWAAGARGLLLRDAKVEALAAALCGLAQGLVVLEPLLANGVMVSAGTTPHLLAEPLTPRELEVLKRMAEGLSNKLIARALAISEHTIKFHVNAILGKLGAQSRTEAVVRATRAGLILL